MCRVDVLTGHTRIYMDSLANIHDVVPADYTGPVETYWDPLARCYVMAPTDKARSEREVFSRVLSMTARVKGRLARSLAPADTAEVRGIWTSATGQDVISQDILTQWDHRRTRAVELDHEADVHASYPVQQSLERRALDRVDHHVTCVHGAPIAQMGMTGPHAPTADYPACDPRDAAATHRKPLPDPTVAQLLSAGWTGVSVGLSHIDAVGGRAITPHYQVTIVSKGKGRRTRRGTRGGRRRCR